MSGLIADSRTMIDRARVEAQVEHCYFITRVEVVQRCYSSHLRQSTSPHFTTTPSYLCCSPCGPLYAELVLVLLLRSSYYFFPLPLLLFLLCIVLHPSLGSLLVLNVVCLFPAAVLFRRLNSLQESVHFPHQVTNPHHLSSQSSS